jgi:ribose transport system substrate-binding protein
MDVRMPVQRSLSFGTACLAALLLAACGGSPDDAPEAPGKPRVALIMKSLANEFFIDMADGARAHQAANPGRYELIVNGIKNESDLAQQVSLLEQMMASQVDVIVLAPADSRGLVPVAKRALDQGIIVINIDNRLDQDTLAGLDARIPFVGPDNREGAYQVGMTLAAGLAPGDEVAIIGGIPSAYNARERAAGFRSAMEETGMTIVTTQAADWEQAKAAQVASAILNENPELDAFLCANDSMALGAVAAVRQAGRAGEIEVVGFDNISAARELVASGGMLATADQYGDQLAVFGIEYALQILEGGAIPADRKTPVDVITGDSL